MFTIPFATDNFYGIYFPNFKILLGFFRCLGSVPRDEFNFSVIIITVKIGSVSMISCKGSKLKATGNFGLDTSPLSKFSL